jgi:hypothetical protein
MRLVFQVETIGIDQYGIVPGVHAFEKSFFVKRIPGYAGFEIESVIGKQYQVRCFFEVFSIINLFPVKNIFDDLFTFYLQVEEFYFNLFSCFTRPLRYFPARWMYNREGSRAKTRVFSVILVRSPGFSSSR